jgi:hypothetical protein
MDIAGIPWEALNRLNGLDTMETGQSANKSLLFTVCSSCE